MHTPRSPTITSSADGAGHGQGSSVHVLIVCTANIARSPLAAAMVDDLVGSGVQVSSAGTRARPDLPAAEESVALGKARGLDLTAHRSRPVERDLVAGADLVLTMSERQREVCSGLAPRAVAKTFTFRELARLIDAIDATSASPTDDAAARLRWVRDAAHHARPRARPARGAEDVSDPIGEPWDRWVTLGDDLDDLVGRIAYTLGR